MSVTLQNGLDNITIRTLSNGNTIAGSKIASVLADDTIKQVLNLQGNEAVEASVNGGRWSAVNSDYKIPAGASLRFQRAAGEKGFLIVA